MADFVWDAQKESLNLAKHHFDFETASQIWGGQIVEKVDERRDYGDQHHRHWRGGRISYRCCVYVARGDSPHNFREEGELS